MAWSAVNEKKNEKTKTMRNRVVETLPSTGAISSEIADRKKLEKRGAGENSRDLQSGMELLQLDFLLSIVENTKGTNPKDVTMRKLNFTEILRRGKQNHIDSKALAVYVTNRDNLYSKDIQCNAMRELAERTLRMNRQEPISTS